MSKTIVVLNAAAGSAADRRELLARLARRHQCELYAPHDPTQLPALVRALVAEGTRRIIVAGGDGTIAQVVNAILPDFPDVEIAVVPLGTGNDLARALDVPLDDMELAFDLAATRQPVPLDVIRVQHGTTRYCVNAATGGFGGEVTASLDASNKQLWGPFAYWLTAMAKLADLHAFDVELGMDDTVSRQRIYGIEISNGRYVGGGFPIASRALVNDGLLDVAVVPELPPLELLAAGLNFMWGRGSVDGGVVAQRVRRVSVRSEPPMPFSLDGEATVAFDATFEVVPAALRFVAGDQPESFQPAAPSPNPPAVLDRGWPD